MYALENLKNINGGDPQYTPNEFPQLNILRDII